MPQKPNQNIDHTNAVFALSRNSFEGDNLGRIRLLREAQALCRRLETPWECLARHIWIDPAVSAAIKIGQDSRILSELPVGGPGRSTDEIADTTRCDPELTRRILRVLASAQFIEQLDTDHFRGSEKSQAFLGQGFKGGMTHLCRQVLPTFAHLPKYLAGSGYKCPNDSRRGPWHTALGTEESFFEWLASHPQDGQGFNDLMAVFHDQIASSWLDTYPVSELISGLEAGQSPDPFVVDVGGGTGGDMENLRRALLPREFSLVVQDLDSVVRQADNTHPSIRLDAHDFFQEQPIHGARAYFMHSILHDWPDDMARSILRKLKPALRPGISKILVCENVMSDRVHLPVTDALDLVMMGLLSSKERTEGDWTRLVESAGLYIKKIWGLRRAGQCVIEIMAGVSPNGEARRTSKAAL